MILSLAVALVISQSSANKVQIIKGGNKKAKTETSLTAPKTGPSAEQQAREQALTEKSMELDAKSNELNQRADEMKAKDDANEAKRDADAKTRAAQQKAIEKHAKEMQQEYEKAANALAGQE